MRISAAAFLTALLAACSPVPSPVPEAPAPAPARNETIVPAAAVPPRTAEAPRATADTFSGITFEGVSFDAVSHRLVIADQPAGPGTRYTDAHAASDEHGGIAAVNAGFFTPEGTPLGLVISVGKTTGSWNSSSLGSGVFHEDKAGTMAITRRETLGRTGASTMRELLQAGPMLIDHGRAVSGLDAAKTSARTFIAWDGGSRWWVGRTTPCSLSDLAAVLSSTGPAGWPLRHALNLDGGRSSDLWISGSVSGGPVSRRPPWNRPVRNFLILKPR